MWVIVVWLGQTAESLALALEYIPIAYTDSLEPVHLWMDTFFSLEIVVRALNSERTTL